MKKFTDPHNKHLRRYILLSVIIFSLVGIGHLLLFMNNLHIVIDEITISIVANYLAFFLAAMMVLMGVYYYKATKK